MPAGPPVVIAAISLGVYADNEHPGTNDGLVRPTTTTTPRSVPLPVVDVWAADDVEDRT
jgi:hypothetical protein